MKKYLLELPREVHAALKAQAALEEKSVKQLLLEIITEYLEKKGG